jgi:hypothetical protein
MISSIEKTYPSQIPSFTSKIPKASTRSKSRRPTKHPESKLASPKNKPSLRLLEEQEEEERENQQDRLIERKPIEHRSPPRSTPKTTPNRNTSTASTPKNTSESISKSPISISTDTVEENLKNLELLQSKSRQENLQITEHRSPPRSTSRSTPKTTPNRNTSTASTPKNTSASISKSPISISTDAVEEKLKNLELLQSKSRQENLQTTDVSFYLQEIASQGTDELNSVEEIDQRVVDEKEKSPTAKNPREIVNNSSDYVKFYLQQGFDDERVIKETDKSLQTEKVASTIRHIDMDGAIHCKTVFLKSGDGSSVWSDIESDTPIAQGKSQHRKNCPLSTTTITPKTANLTHQDQREEEQTQSTTSTHRVDVSKIVHATSKQSNKTTTTVGTRTTQQQVVFGTGCGCGWTYLFGGRRRR